MRTRDIYLRSLELALPYKDQSLLAMINQSLYRLWHATHDPLIPDKMESVTGLPPDDILKILNPE